MNMLVDYLHIKHYFVVGYSPWANGSVERCMKEVLWAARALLSELNMALRDWPAVVNMIQTSLNGAPLERMGMLPGGTHRSPLEVMIGLKPARLSIRLLSQGIAENRVGIIEVSRSYQLMKIDRLQTVFHNVHKDVGEKVEKNRKKQIEFHNQMTSIISPNLELGILFSCAGYRTRNISFILSC